MDLGSEVLRKLSRVQVVVEHELGSDVATGLDDVATAEAIFDDTISHIMICDIPWSHLHVDRGPANSDLTLVHHWLVGRDKETQGPATSISLLPAHLKSGEPFGIPALEVRFGRGMVKNQNRLLKLGSTGLQTLAHEQ